MRVVSYIWVMADAQGRMSGTSPVCVGRAAALAVLREQLDMAVGGVPRVVWVDGEPGVGKTTLVRTLLAEGSCRAVWASGDEDETSLSYGLLTTLHAAMAQV